MSFDLAVWFEPAAISVEHADQVYGRLCEEEPAGLAAHPSVTAFYEELTTRYPEIDTLTDDDVEPSPWSAAHSVDDTHLLMSVTWSRSVQVAGYVRKLAAAHGLVCFDPQEQRVHHPPQLATPPRMVLSCHTGADVPDPDDARIAWEIRHMSRDNWFVILERGDWYVQVGYGEQAGTRPGWYALERRDGSADTHYRTEVSDVAEITMAFTGFAHEQVDWIRRFSWNKLDL